MKTKVLFFIMYLLFMNETALVYGQNLDSLPQTKRDSILISIAKEVALTHGPGYYREYKAPVIKRAIYPEEIDEGKNAGRIIYSVIFLYDKTKEQLEMDVAAAVAIWGDSGKPQGVRFGNGLIRLIPETGLRSGEVIEQVPYEQREVIPVVPLK
jgi:hypothetical protein